MARAKNLQPWLDYFKMLQRYEKEGFLLMDAEKHEAYVTRAALFTVAGYDDDPEALADSSYPAILRRTRAIAYTVRRIRSYAAWLSREGKDYLSRPFAINVVDDDASTEHEPLYTITVTTKRRWWKLWMLHDNYEVIAYD